jgi:hypothetical protein
MSTPPAAPRITRVILIAFALGEALVIVLSSYLSHAR